jgi:dCMP deaminase
MGAPRHTTSPLGINGHNFYDLLQEQLRSSDDPDRQVAALLFDQTGGLIGSAANGFITPPSDKDELRKNRSFGQKYFWIEHAERRVILQSLRAGFSLESATIVASLFPCADCARVIAQSGIKTVIAPSPSPTETKYRETMKAALEILEISDIKVLELKNSDPQSYLNKS